MTRSTMNDQEQSPVTPPSLRVDSRPPSVQINSDVEIPQNCEIKRSSSDQLTSDPDIVHPEKTSAIGKKYPPLRKTRRCGVDSGDSWLWEICCAALGVVGIALLVVFTFKIDDTSYADWQYTASPNTVISIIMTVTKAVFLTSVAACLGQLKWNVYQRPAPLQFLQTIDEASRGPWGSLQVLWKVHMGSKSGILILSGAALTLVSLAVDPFAQQILSFPSRIIKASNETAIIQYAHNYTWGSDMWYPNVGMYWPLQKAVLSGLLLEDTPLKPECSSGSCSYPGFVSLGVCSRCEDVTKKTIQDCVGSVFKRNGSTWVGPGDGWEGINCTYTAPYGFNFTLTIDEMITEEEQGDKEWGFGVDYSSSFSKGFTRTFDIETPILSIVAIDQTVSITYTPENTTIPPPKPAFTQCALYWCEKEFGTSKLSISGYTLPILRTQQLTHKFSVDGSYTWYQGSLWKPRPGKKPLSHISSSYYIEETSGGQLKELLVSLFGHSLCGTDESSSDTMYNAHMCIPGLLQRRNVTQVMESISNKITDTIRADNTSGRIPGKAFRTETYIHVKWPWMILPFFAVLASVALLSTTILATRKSSGDAVPSLWKSSVFPLLMARLDIAPEYNFNSLQSVDEASRVSKRVIVTMERDPDLILSER